MSTASKPIVSQLISGRSTAANADEVGETVAAEKDADIGIDTVIEPRMGASSGWDAYEVWRRFIKDARDRRKQQDPN